MMKILHRENFAVLSRSFLLCWVLANAVGLPALLLPYRIGRFIVEAVAIITDLPFEMVCGVICYVLISVVLALSGAMIGAWLGLMQWLPLKARIRQSGKWIVASSLGVAIGAPLSHLVYWRILESPIVRRPGGVYSSWYADVTLWVLLGLTISVSQWVVLRKQVQGAGWWILVWPICFPLGIVLWKTPIIVAIQLLQSITTAFPNLEIPGMQVFRFLNVLGAITALIGVGFITGILLRGLLRVPKAQADKQYAGS